MLKKLRKLSTLQIALLFSDDDEVAKLHVRYMVGGRALSATA